MNNKIKKNIYNNKIIKAAIFITLILLVGTVIFIKHIKSLLIKDTCKFIENIPVKSISMEFKHEKLELDYDNSNSQQILLYIIDSKGDILNSKENFFDKLNKENEIELSEEIIKGIKENDKNIKIIKYNEDDYFIRYLKINNSSELNALVLLPEEIIVSDFNKILIFIIFLVITMIIIVIVLFVIIIRLNRKYIKLKNDNINKRMILASMGHEARTPISGIIGLISKTQKEINDKKKVKDNLEKVKLISEDLLELVNDILNASKVELGQIKALKQKININRMIENINIIIKDKVVEKNQTYKVITEGIDNLNIIGDGVKLKQVILNLLINANKFTQEEGEITLKVKRISEDIEGKVKVMFEVEDNGIGISEEFIEKIFEPFLKVDNFNNNNFEGVGLGLYICKELIQLMGSNLIVESTLGKGSVFRFYLDFDKYFDKEREIANNELDLDILRNKKVLLAEDNEINRMIAIEILEDLGLIVEYATNGKEAIEMFKASDINYYNYIFMDVRMPIIDGYNVTKKIRNSMRPDAKNIKIIAMTANTFPEDKEESLNIGMDKHISKPINKKSIIEALLN